ncbi:MATE family efflux transporter [Clostridium sp. CS001]|uniref:MATE family efflux transporter n=1 Tax=Clostridium sp. CS001 TaxID=2880648 RepID=UPI001CF5D866|nr:MATE family efflux transporter [Clostridium sp. CS001]MCB2289151.1 MATE family efflux transporter [Clostridium sp. CS001]
MSSISSEFENSKIGKLLFKLALPCIIAQLVNVSYNIVDRVFIGRLPSGELAMAGVGVSFPIILVISAFSALIGMGGAPLAAMKMGEKKNEAAEEIMSNSFSMLIITGLTLTLIFMVFKDPILWAFGASEQTIAYARDYITLYLIGTVFVQLALGMNVFLNTQGFTKISMCTVIIGAVINIVLDPILIFVFDMGVQGAALATIIAQMVSAIWVLKFLFGKKTTLKIRKKFLVPKARVLIPIISLGVSPFIMQSTESLVLISLNTKLQAYGGDIAVGAMTILASIMQIIFLPLSGLTQGAQPIISYNYGAKNLHRVKATFKLLFTCCVSYTVIMTSILMLFPQIFVSVFTSDPDLTAMAVWSIRIYFVGISIFGAQIACQQCFLALGQARISTLLALLRKVILLIPLIFILPNFFEDKLFATLLAEPIADIIAVIVTSSSFFIFYKKTLNNS